MNNLEPRAKIGDVVIVKDWYYWDRSEDDTTWHIDELKQFKIIDAYTAKHYAGTEPDTYVEEWHYEVEIPGFSEDECAFDDHEILKNLTTNVSYE